MSKLLQLRIRPKTSYLTPLHSDIIFGHLCWEVLYRWGEVVLADFLHGFMSSPPFLLSDGFPEEKFPRLLTNLDFGREKVNKIDIAEEIRQTKKYKNIKYISKSSIKKFQDGLSIDDFYVLRDETIIRSRKAVSKKLIGKNVIDRQTNTTMDGGVFDQEEVFSRVEYWSVYWKVMNDDFWNKYEIQKLVESMFLKGFGAKKSTGKGVFELFGEQCWEEKTDWETKQTGYSLLLSHAILRGDERMILNKSFYDLGVKYGKLGESMSHNSNPFKKPIIQLLPGSVLATGKEYVGGMVNLSSSFERAVDFQYGLLLSINLPK